jgi:hypothetical protein
MLCGGVIINHSHLKSYCSTKPPERVELLPEAEIERVVIRRYNTNSAAQAFPVLMFEDTKEHANDSNTDSQWPQKSRSMLSSFHAEKHFVPSLESKRAEDG